MKELDNSLISVHDLSHCLGISVATIYRMVAETRIPFYKIGNRIKFDEKDIDAWKALKKVEPRRDQ